MKKIFFAAAWFTCLSASCQKQHEYKIIKTYHIASPGGWDYIAVNDGKLYVSHSTQVNILNENTGDSIGVILHTNGVHGIAFDNALGKGFISNGRANNVTVFNLNTGATITEIATGQNPDAIMYDGYSGSVITCNGRGRNLSVIDPKTNEVVATIDLAGKPETAVSDGAGKLFVNIEDKNEIVEVDLSKRMVENRWSLDGGEGPTGLAYDKKTKRLFAGCEKLLVIMNAENGKIEARLPIGAGCDGVAFDAKNKIIYTANGEGSLSVVKENDKDKFTLIGNYVTKPGARTITIDEKTGVLFLPTSDFDSTNPQRNGRARMVPGTFQVLVVE